MEKNNTEALNKILRELKAGDNKSEKEKIKKLHNFCLDTTKLNGYEKKILVRTIKKCLKKILKKRDERVSNGVFFGWIKRKSDFLHQMKEKGMYFKSDVKLVQNPKLTVTNKGLLSGEIASCLNTVISTGYKLKEETNYISEAYILNSKMLNKKYGDEGHKVGVRMNEVLKQTEWACDILINLYESWKGQPKGVNNAWESISTFEKRLKTKLTEVKKIVNEKIDDGLKKELENLLLWLNKKPVDRKTVEQNKKQEEPQRIIPESWEELNKQAMDLYDKVYKLYTKIIGNDPVKEKYKIKDAK